jgi:hypothetical protein
MLPTEARADWRARAAGGGAAALSVARARTWDSAEQRGVESAQALRALQQLKVPPRTTAGAAGPGSRALCGELREGWVRICTLVRGVLAGAPGTGVELGACTLGAKRRGEVATIQGACRSGAAALGWPWQGMEERGPSALTRARVPGPPQDLAPVTLFADAGAEGGLASAWSRMPASLGGGAGGLLPPLQCKEVSACPRRPSRMRTPHPCAQRLGACAGTAREGLSHVRCYRERGQARGPRRCDGQRWLLPPPSHATALSAAAAGPCSTLPACRADEVQMLQTAEVLCMWSPRAVVRWRQSRRARGQVFKLEAGPDVDPAAARRQLQKYVGTFRGRALMGPLPLPAPAAKGGAVKVSVAGASGVVSTRSATLSAIESMHGREQAAAPAAASSARSG